MPVPQIIAALLLFVLGIVILVGRWPMRWRAALFCGVAAFWLWSTALGLASFVKVAGEFRHFSASDPRTLASELGGALIHSGYGCLFAVPLLILTGISFFVHREPR